MQPTPKWNESITLNPPKRLPPPRRYEILLDKGKPVLVTITPKAFPEPAPLPLKGQHKYEIRGSLEGDESRELARDYSNEGLIVDPRGRINRFGENMDGADRFDFYGEHVPEFPSGNVMTKRKLRNMIRSGRIKIPPNLVNSFPSARIRRRKRAFPGNLAAEAIALVNNPGLAVPADVAVRGLANRYGASNVMVGDDNNVYVRNAVTAGLFKKIGRLARGRRPGKRHPGGMFASLSRVMPDAGRPRRVLRGIPGQMPPGAIPGAGRPRGWMSRLALQTLAKPMPATAAGMGNAVVAPGAVMLDGNDAFIGNDGTVLRADAAAHAFGAFGGVYMSGDGTVYLRNEMGIFKKIGKAFKKGFTAVRKFAHKISPHRIVKKFVAKKIKPIGKVLAFKSKIKKTIVKKVITPIAKLAGKALIEAARWMAGVAALPIRLIFFARIGRPRANAIAKNEGRSSANSADKAKAIAWGLQEIKKMPVVGAMANLILTFSKGTPLAGEPPRGSQREAERIMGAVEMGLDPATITAYTAAITAAIGALSLLLNFGKDLFKKKEPEPAPAGQLQEGQMPGEVPPGHVPGRNPQRYTPEHPPGEMPPGQDAGEQYEGQQEGRLPGEGSIDVQVDARAATENPEGHGTGVSAYMRRIQAMRDAAAAREQQEAPAESSGWIECGWAVI